MRSSQMLIPDINDFQRLENRNLLSYRIKRLFKDFILPLIFLTFLLLSIALFLSNKNENTQIKNEIKDFFILSPSLTKINEKRQTEQIKDINKNIKIENLIDEIKLKSFSGNWQSLKNKIETSNGLIYIQFLHKLSFNENDLVIALRFTQGKYINKWYALYGKIPISNLTYNFNESNYINLYGEFNSESENGKIFERLNYSPKCNAKIDITFQYDKLLQNFDYVNNIIGTIESKCLPDDISFNISIQNTNREYKIILNYSIIMSIICFLSAINTSWLNFKINDYELYAKSISLLTVYENIIWNSYGSLCHFCLTINYSKYFKLFLFPTIFYFANFSITDLRLLYTLWRLTYGRLYTNPILVRKKLIRTFIIFYTATFFSLFFIIKFYFKNEYIILEIILTWIPQILYNIKMNNSISMPLLYVIFISFYRLFIPCYFKSYEDNFFLIQPDIPFVFLSILLMILFIIILYSQTLFGSRWFLPKKYRKNEYEFYKTKEELQLIKSDADKLECVICLCPLFTNGNLNNVNSMYNVNTTTTNETIKYFKDDFIQTGDNEHVQIKNENKYFILFKKIFKKLFYFHHKEKSKNKKPFMITPCGHSFHSECLESWLLRKKECPNCRTEFKQTINV